MSHPPPSPQTGRKTAKNRENKMVKSRLGRVINYIRLKLTNGVAEGLNSRIMTIKRRACGYRNQDHFKMAIFIFCGGLDLYPRLLTHKNA
jgi:transposase